MEIFQKYGALNPDGTVNKNAPDYKAAVTEIEPKHAEMMARARELGAQREGINQEVYDGAGSKLKPSGTNPQEAGGRGGFGDSEGTADSVGGYEKIAKGFKEKGYTVDRQPDYIKIEELDTVVHRPAGTADAVGSSANEARVAAQTQGPETAGSAYGQNKYQLKGQGGQYAANDDMGAALDSVKKIQEAVNADPQTPWERYQRDQVIAKETNRIRDAAGMGEDPLLAKVKKGDDPDLMPELKDPVKQAALDQARSAWPAIEKNNKQNLADLDQAIANAKTPEEAHQLMAEKDDILNRQEGTKKAIFEEDGGKAFSEVTGKAPGTAETGDKPVKEFESAVTNDRPINEPTSEPAKTVKIGDEPAAGGTDTVKVNGSGIQEAASGSVTEFMKNNGGKIALVLTAAQTLNCLSQGKTVSQCAIELVEGLGIGEGVVIVLGPTGAAILGGAIGAYQIYDAGVETTKQWADAQQRKAAYDNREKQTQYNLENIDQYINDFREKKIYGELQSSSAATSDACRAVDAQVQSITDSAPNEADDINDYNLGKLLPVIKAASDACSGVASLAAEIADLQSKSTTYEDTIIKGLDWARATAEKCGSADEANKIRDMYENCTNLAAEIQGYFLIAKDKNSMITLIIDKGSEATKALTTAQAMTVKIIAKSAQAESILPQIKSAVERKNTHVALSSSILGEIEQLRKGFPDTLLPVNEAKFTELRGLVEKYKALRCDAETTDWTVRLNDVIAHAQDILKSLDEAKSAVSSCQNLTPQDQAMESIDGSANWVLTALGMNEDLLEKADSCLVNLNAPKESLMAAANCPANSTPVWNEQTMKAQCQCSKGYTWDDAQTACLADKAAQVAAAQCPVGSQPYWDDTTSAVRCHCPNGFKWNQDVTSCIVDKPAQIAMVDCSGIPNSHPYWDEKQNKAMCWTCNPGYKWKDGFSTECVIDNEARTAAVATTDCSKYPNSRAHWDETKNQPWCSWCNPGYKWKDSVSIDCVVDKEAQVAMADCSGTPNSRPYWDEKANDVRCSYCLQGSHWKNDAGLDCVADNNGDDNGPSWDGLNISGAVTQIINAETQYRQDVNRINNDYNNGLRQLNNQPPPVANDVNPPTQAPDIAKCMQHKQDLNNQIAGWQKSIKCINDGVSKYKAWIDCNGNWMMTAPNIAIFGLQTFITNAQKDLNAPCN